MKTSMQSSIKAGWQATTAAGILFGMAAWAANYPGYVKVENFDNINGGNVADLTASTKYASNEWDSVILTNASLYYSRVPGADNYGSRISGYIIPQETADYVFFVAADDSTSLYLSTDSSPANLKLIAADQGWQNSRTWVGVGGTSSGDGTTNVIFRRGFNPGPAVLEANGYQWVGPFQNRSDQFLHSPLTNMLGSFPQVPWPTTDANGDALIHLAANQSYYFELLYKEGSGGENTGVAWKKATDPDPANGDPEIQGTFLSVDWTNVVTFKTQPQSQTVAVNQPVTFSVYAIGIPGDADPALFTYQWLLNGADITDGTGNGATYTILAPTLADSGKKFSVRVTTGGGLTGTSAAATLTVVSDVVPPTILTLRSSDTFTSAKITYSEAVRNEAVDPANYQFGGGLTVSDANFDIVVNDPLNPENPKDPTNPSNRVAVILFTSKQTEGATYNLTVNNVKDITGNALTPNTATLFAPKFKAGLLNYKRWMGGNSIPTLLGDTLRYENPTAVETRTIAATGGQNNTYVAGTYVDRVDGFFIPTNTGNHVFLMSADNDGYLYLSTDSDPANMKMIAADVGWQNTATWTGPGTDNNGNGIYRRGDLAGNGPFENRSDQFLTSQRTANGLPPNGGIDPQPWPNTDVNGNAVISLTAGQRYYFALYHTESDSGRAEATFKLAGAPDPANGTASIITSAFIGAMADPTSFPPVITNQPANVNFSIGSTINLTVGVDSPAAVTYQWYKNQGPVAGGTAATLTINNASLADIGSYYVAATNVNGFVGSQPAAVLPTTPVPSPLKTFQQDATGLTSIEAEHYYDTRTGADGHVWVPVSGRPGNSGSGHVAVLPDRGDNYGSTDFNRITNGARLDFKVNFNAAGNNYLWIRGGDAFPAGISVGSGAGDSVHAGIDGALTVVQITGAPSFTVCPGWNWVGTNNANSLCTIAVPSAGIHTVSLWMREDGFSADKIVLTTDPTYVPTGLGPPESAEVTARPTISVTRNASGAPVITYTGTLESASDASGPYNTVTGASGGTYTPDLKQAAQQFYRAKQ